MDLPPSAVGNECDNDCLTTQLLIEEDSPLQVDPQNDQNEIVNDVEPKDIENKCDYKLVDVIEKVEAPTEGMVFSSIEEVTLYYRSYGKQEGFAVVQRKIKKLESGCPHWISLGCSRHGNTKTTSSNTYSNPNPTTKTGCKAHFNAKLVETKWVVTTVAIDHNHALSPGKARYFRCNRNLNGFVKRKLDVNDHPGVPPSKNFNAFDVEAEGSENLPSTEKDCRNYLKKARHLRLGQGGAEALRDYFTRMQGMNDGFYFMIDLDDESRLRNVFWADARSRASYESFGDVVTFDTTYLTNGYRMPFAPFVGVNHHGQSMLFGAGLLSSEDTENFVWLFQTWLKCMNNRAPRAIITDQDRAMKEAIARVFPKTRHKYCLWHILKKISEKFRAHLQYDDINSALRRCVYESQTCGEFEASWQTLLESYNLKDNDWLYGLYSERTFWVPAYLKDVFWAEMTTTQQSESMNAFFDGYVHPSTTLKQFVDQYDIALQKKVENEAFADFNSFNSTLPCVTFFSFEKKFQQVYIIAKFKEVQAEILGKMYCNASLLNKEGVICTHQVIEQVVVHDAYVKQVRYVVHFNKDEDEMEVKCTCGSFESRGILCRHAIAVLGAYNITSLPPKYYLDRWRKDVKRKYTLVKSSYDSLSNNPNAERYDILCKDLQELAEIAATTVDYYTKVKRHIDILKKEFSGSSYEASSPSVALPGTTSSTYNESIDGDGVAVESNKEGIYNGKSGSEEVTRKKQ